MKRCSCVIWFWLFYLTVSWSQSLETRIDFSIEDASYVEALTELIEKGQIKIAYSSRFFPKRRKISLDFSATTIESILTKILENTDVNYQLIGSQVVLAKKTTSLKKQFILSGYVELSDSGEKLIAASVLDASTGKWCLTNEYGFFSLKLPEGPTTIRVSYLGTTDILEEVIIEKNETFQFELEPSTTLSEVIVTPNVKKEEEPLFATSQVSHRISESLLNVAPALGGEADVLRTAQLLPGIQSGVDGFGGMFVRGGDSGQNLMLLDGVPIYNPFHLLGVFSVYNSTAIRNTQVFRGAFPARYGGRIASVFDVHMREGNNKQWTGTVGSNLLSANASIEGPILKRKGSLLLTARRSHFKVLLEPALRRTFTPGEEEEVNFYFYDINAKLNYAFSDKDRLLISFYNGGDFYESEEEQEEGEMSFSREEQLEWGNTIAAIRWNHLFGPRLFSNTTLTQSYYRYDYDQLLELVNIPGIDERFFYNTYGSNIRDVSLKVDFDYLHSSAHTFRFGTEIINHRFKPVSEVFSNTDDLPVDNLSLDIFDVFIDDLTFRTTGIHGYLEDDWQINPKWRVNIGGRLSSFIGIQSDYINFEPRINSRYAITPQLYLNTSLSRMVQYLHLLANSKVRTPADIWLPSGEDLDPEKSWQYDLGLKWKTNRGWNLNMETYYKRTDQILSASDLELFDVSPGVGKAYGLEFLAEKQEGKSGGWLSYALSWSNRQFPDYNLGRQFPFRYDRRHQLKMYFYHKFNDRLTLSTNWIYESANPQIFIYDVDLESIPFPAESGNENLSRGKANHRLDFMLSYEFNKKRWKHLFKIGAYNVYNRKNPAFYRFELNDSGQLVNEPVHLMPFIPSIYYQLKF